MNVRPEANEYRPHYGQYIQLVPEGEIEDILRAQQSDICDLLQGIPDVTAQQAYAPGKWRIQEVVGHIADTERVMAYRLLAIARGDTESLAGFDQDVYAQAAKFDVLQWTQVQADFDTVRSATLSLLGTLDDDAWARRGTVSNHAMSTRALAYTIAGHAAHHVAILREKYLVGE